MIADDLQLAIKAKQPKECPGMLRQGHGLPK